MENFTKESKKNKYRPFIYLQTCLPCNQKFEILLGSSELPDASPSYSPNQDSAGVGGIHR